MSQKHSTPNSSQSQSQSQSQTKKRGTAQKNDKKQPSQAQISLNEDFDTIEEFFKVLDDDLPGPKVLPKKKGKSPKDDSGIDPTMASKSITILEQKTLMSSGFHSSLNLANDFDAFGDEMDFQRLIMETDEVVTTQSNLMSASSELITQTPFCKRKSMNLNESLKKRRLTYEEFEKDIDTLQNAPLQLPFSLDEEFLDPIQDIVVSSFDPCSNGPQETTQAELQEGNIEINEPPPSPIPMELNQTFMIPEIESQLVLEDISNDSLSSKKRKNNRKLIVDKVIKYDFATLQKNPEKYMTTIRETPFMEYSNKIDMRKSSVDLLFSSPCSTLKNGSTILRKLFERNLKKIPMSASKKRKHVEIEDTVDMENAVENSAVKKRRKTMRARDVLKDLNETNMIVEEMDLELPNVAIINDFNEIQIPMEEEFIENTLPPAIEQLSEFNDENTQVQHLRRRQRRQSDEGEDG